MQITGFDTPGTLRGIIESKWSLESCKNILNDINLKNSEDYQNLVNQYGISIEYINSNKSFNDFDRLEFFKEHLSKIYYLLLKVQLENGIETIDDITSIPSSTIYNANNIFSKDFLNKYYFANISKSELEEKRIELGRLLFFDPILSKNNKRACASCHKPSKQFTDNLQFSKSNFLNDPITRNTPTLINSIFAKDYFYDLRSGDLNSQIQNVITNHKELNSNLEEIIKKINDSDEYKALFANAFKNYNENQELNFYLVSQSISYYLSSLVDFDTDFDRYIRNEPKSFITEKAKKGFNLFMGKAQCGICHFPPTFSGLLPPYYNDTESEVIGVPIDSTNKYLDKDKGIFESGRLKHKAKKNRHAFKTTTIRNSFSTPPFFHNGVYNSLEEVLIFYNEGGGNGFGFNLENQTLSSNKLNLSQEEIESIIEFIKSINSDSIIDTTEVIVLPKLNNDKYNTRKYGGEY